MTPLRVDRLLALPLRLHGIQVGRPVDLLLDLEERKAVGLDVLCGDEVHRFLPLPTAAVSDDEIAIRSPFVLLEEDQLAFYRQRAVELATLRGKSVQHHGRHAGALEDVVVRADGTVTALVVDGRELAYDESVQIQPSRRAAAVS
jgi:sporulation protein YlmC with PRC-barrel domain